VLPVDLVRLVSHGHVSLVLEVVLLLGRQEAARVDVLGQKEEADDSDQDGQETLDQEEDPPRLKVRAVDERDTVGDDSVQEAAACQHLTKACRRLNTHAKGAIANQKATRTPSFCRV